MELWHAVFMYFHFMSFAVVKPIHSWWGFMSLYMCKHKWDFMIAVIYIPHTTYLTLSLTKRCYEWICGSDEVFPSTSSELGTGNKSSLWTSLIHRPFLFICRGWNSKSRTKREKFIRLKTSLIITVSKVSFFRIQTWLLFRRVEKGGKLYFTQISH